MRRVIAFAGVLALGVTATAYQYEKAGYPPSVASASAAATCVVRTGRAWAPKAAEASLDARYRTMLASDSIRLMTTPVTGVCIIVR